MPQRTWLLGLGVLVLAVGLMVFRGLSSGADPAPPASADPGAVLPAGDGDRPVDDGPTEASLAPDDDGLAAGDARSEVPPATTTKPTWRLDGRVTWEGARPADELLAVVAGDLRAPVGADGRFALDVPEDARRLTLDLEGRYLRLAQARTLDRAGLDALAGGGPLTLEAELGAWLRVDLLPGDDLTRAELDGAEVRVAVHQGSPSWSRDLVGLGGGRFEIGGLPVDQLVSVAVAGEAFADTAEVDLRAFAGKPLDLTFEVRRGATLAGVVVDAAGAPVADALVSVARENPRPGTRVNYVDRTNLRTDSDGTFRYRGLDEGAWRAEVRADGLLDLARDLGTLTHGEVREGERLELVRGLAVRGTARVAGGEPIPAELRLTRSGSPGRAVAAGVALDDGTFALDGLEPGSYVLAAAWSDDAGAVWRATAPDLVLVDADLDGVALLLTAGDRITGVVQADDGTPLDRFTVEAKPLGADLAVLPKGAVRERFRKAGGRFELVGLAPGAWDVTVTAKDHADARPVRVHVPEGPHELVATLDRLARVAGVVRGPDGAPVAGAEVVALAPAAVDEDTTDDEGRFELDRVVPGAVALVAEREGLRDAAAVELVLAPGEARDGVELALRTGARLVGRVDASIEDVTARPVLASPEDSYENRSALPDEDGAFAFEGLEPGTWSVMFDWMSGAGPDWTVGYAAREEVTVELVEGETTEVVLGAPRPGAVALSGLVTEAGAPREAYLVYVYPEHNDTAKPAAMPLTIARTDAEGRYDLELPAAGTYHFSVGPDTTFQVRFLETVAAADQATLDFALPGCVIAGRVERTDGTPAARHPLMLVRAGAPVDSRTFGDLHSGAADADGVFRFEGIQPGRYLLRTGGWGLASEGLGVRVLRDLEVAEGAPVDDLLVVVGDEAVLGGTVVDAAGAPVVGADLHVFDAAGSRLFVWRGHRTDHAGAFRILGVGAGPVTVRATGPDGAAAEATLDLAPGQVADVPLQLEG